MTKIRCAVLGSTGIVGQRFIKLLEDHPFFELTIITASEKNTGKKYGEAVRWHIDGEIPSYSKNLNIQKVDYDLFKKKNIKVVFSALPPEIAKNIEKTLAENGFAVFSNSRAHRYDKNVPILIPEINPNHIKLIENQLKTQKGFIITNANCTTSGLVIALKPLLEFNIKTVIVSTYQALSGAGYPGVSSLDINGNVIPFIEGEEEKIQIESEKILGTFQENKIIKQNITIISSCTRVPVKDGHLESVVVEFEKEVDISSIKKAFQNLQSIRNLPTSPEKVIILRKEKDRPQQIRDAYAGTPERAMGMSVSVGRLKKQQNRIRFFLVVHNTLRGAAGNSVLNAEYAYKKGYLKGVI